MKIEQLGEARNDELPQVEKMEKDAAELVEPNRDQEQGQEGVASFLFFGREKKCGKKNTQKNAEYVKDVL
jgi:hypothetical protein